MKNLENKVAIITGGCQGIGRATVQLFLEKGARVAVWDIDEQKGNDLVSAFPASNIKFYKINTTDFSKIKDAAQAVENDFGRIDILINNAGITRDATLKKITEEQWHQVIDVNLNGVLYCTKAVYPNMAKNKYGRIINASSVVGIYGNFGQTNYVASKAGVIGMTKVWAKEFGRDNITVNAVAPGFINTEMMSTIPEKILDTFKNKSPLGRLGVPVEIAKLYGFLASDDAAFITGTTISIDGGVSI